MQSATYTGVVYIEIELEEGQEGLELAPAHPSADTPAELGAGLWGEPHPQPPCPAPRVSTSNSQAVLAPLGKSAPNASRAQPSPLHLPARQTNGAAQAATRKRVPTPHPGRGSRRLQTNGASQPSSATSSKRLLTAGPSPLLLAPRQTIPRAGSACDGRPLWSANFAGANEPKSDASRLPALPKFPTTRRVRQVRCLQPQQP